MVNPKSLAQPEFVENRRLPPIVSRRTLLTMAGGLAAATLVAAAPATATQVAHAAPDEPAVAADSGSQTRRNRAYKVRQEAARRQHQAPAAAHPTNGDEERYATRIANFSKGLPHNSLGEVDARAYSALLAAVQGRLSCEAIPLGGTVKLANPQAAQSFQLEGADSHNLTMPAPPAFASETIAGEMTELYWLALARDIPFEQYGQEALTVAALADLQQFASFQLLQPDTLFRGVTAGDRVGPYLSQFLYLDVPYGATTVVQRYRVPVAGDDHMATLDEWLAIQNGLSPARGNTLDPTPRYLRNQRDLGEWVHRDFSYQAFLNAALLLHSFGAAALDPANPYQSSANQSGFVTLGGADVLSMVGAIACLALKAAWAQKWLFHRRLRPEAFGGRLDHHLRGAATYPLHPKLVATQALARVQTHFGTALLPMAYPEGAPTHPAYPAGHATIAGACATLLKAFYHEAHPIPAPKVATGDGMALVDYKGAATLTVGGELNKLAANIALGRDAAGVHWRSDSTEGLVLGEAVALGVLRDLALTYAEPFDGFHLTSFSGTPVVIGGSQAYTAGDPAGDEADAADEYRLFLPGIFS